MSAHGNTFLLRIRGAGDSLGRVENGRSMDEREELSSRLAELRNEHRDLDAAIAALTETSRFDQLQAQRLKKRKLVLKDMIRKIEDMLTPDIIA